MDYKKYEAEKRKKYSLTKKKDLSKITDEEFGILLGIVEDKIGKLRYKLMQTLPNYFGIVIKDKTYSFLIDILDTKIEYFVNLETTKLKSSIVIKEPACWYNIPEASFLYRNHGIINPINTNSKHINVFNFIERVFSDINKLIVKYSDNKNIARKMIINNKNINEFIKDIDQVLLWFFANPAINSATASESIYLTLLKETVNNYKIHDNGKYKIIKEVAYYDHYIKQNNTHQYISDYQIIFKLGNGLFKIDIKIIRIVSAKELSIVLYKWNDTNGWITIDRIGNYDKLLGKLPVPNYNIMPNNLDIYKDGSIDICLIEALKYLHKFFDIKFLSPKFEKLKQNI